MLNYTKASYIIPKNHGKGHCLLGTSRPVPPLKFPRSAPEAAGHFYKHRAVSQR